MTLAAALGLARVGTAAAFPLIDPTNADQVPQGSELASPDAQDLRHQLQIVNGLGAPAGGGWTFVPRIDYQEMLTDNVYGQHSPRDWDVVSYLSPGFVLAGDLPRLTAHLAYAPTLALYTRQSSLNSLTHQLNGIALVTMAPDLAYLDLRAASGVHDATGGLGGLGSLGGTYTSATQSAIPTLAGNAQGLTRGNSVQSGSVSVSPYLLGNFGEWGSGKLGYSLNATQSDSLSSFLAAPFPSGGTNAQSLLSNELNGHLATGDVLGRLQNSIDADLLQSQSTADAGSINGFTGLPEGVKSKSNSSRQVYSDQVSFKVNRAITVFASGGHEDIVYSGYGSQSIHDLTWSLGTTLTPGPDSRLTISYGHRNGTNSLAVDAYYGLTARTVLTLSYGSTLGTQLENLRNQLNLATSGSNGALVNGLTGGPLFTGVNALAVENGVFRTDTLVAGSQTTLDRDIITFNLTLVKQTSSGGVTSTSATAKTVGGTWVHQMQPAMTLNAGLSLSFQDQTALQSSNTGTSTSFVGSLGWQYEVSDSVSLNARFSFFDRESEVTTLSFYQSLLILGVSKTF